MNGTQRFRPSSLFMTRNTETTQSDQSLTATYESIAITHFNKTAGAKGLMRRGLLICAIAMFFFLPIHEQQLFAVNARAEIHYDLCGTVDYVEVKLGSWTLPHSGHANCTGGGGWTFDIDAPGDGNTTINGYIKAIGLSGTGFFNVMVTVGPYEAEACFSSEVTYGPTNADFWGFTVKLTPTDELFQWTPNPLPADGQSHATPSPQRPDITGYSFRFLPSNDQNPLGCSLSSTGVVTAGTNIGTVTVQAYKAGSPCQVATIELVPPECPPCSSGECSSPGTVSAQLKCMDVKIALGASISGASA